MLHTVKDSKTKESWEFSVDEPESLAEATEVDGEMTTFQTYLAGRKVRVDNIARNSFRTAINAEGDSVTGKTREEVEAILKDYKPGQTKLSKEKAASVAIVDNSNLIFEKGLTAGITTAFVARDYDGVIKILNDAKGV